MLVAPKQINVRLSHRSILPERGEANFGHTNGRFMACEVLGFAGYRRAGAGRNAQPSPPMDATTSGVLREKARSRVQEA